MKQCLSFAFVRRALLQTLSPQWKLTVIPWICSTFVSILEGLQLCSSPYRDPHRSQLRWVWLLAAAVQPWLQRPPLCSAPAAAGTAADTQPVHPRTATTCSCVGREFFLMFWGFVFKMKSFHCSNEWAVLDFSGTRIFPVKWALFPSLHLIIVPCVVTLSRENSGKTSLPFSGSLIGFILPQENDFKTLNEFTELTYILTGM